LVYVEELIDRNLVVAIYFWLAEFLVVTSFALGTTETFFQSLLWNRILIEWLLNLEKIRFWLAFLRGVRHDAAVERVKLDDRHHLVVSIRWLFHLWLL
jgi:hypothetical protein